MKEELMELIRNMVADDEMELTERFRIWKQLEICLKS